MPFRSVNVIFFASIVVTHFTTALHPLAVAGIHLQLYDLLILAWVLWFILSDQKIAHQDLLFVAPFAVFGLWAYALSVPVGNFSTFTILIQLLRSLAFFAMTATLARSYAGEGFRSIIAKIFKLVIIINCLAWISSEIGIYQGAFEDGNFNTKRFEGFGNDSNFIGGMILILAALSTPYVSKRWLVVAILLCLLTGSRTVIAVSVVFIIFQIFRQIMSYGAVKFWSICISFIACNLIFLGEFWLQAYDFAVNASFVEGRLQRFTTGSPRFVIWESLISDMLSTVNFWGSGLRSSEEIVTRVSANRYSHNSFLDIAYEYGWIPCLLFITLLACLILKMLRVDSLICFALLILCSMLMTLTIFYLPFVMFVLAVAWTRVSAPLRNVELNGTHYSVGSK